VVEVEPLDLIMFIGSAIDRLSLPCADTPDDSQSGSREALRPELE
jgi:hypothetical protein